MRLCGFCCIISDKMKLIYPKVKTYFELLLLYQARLNQGLVMTYDRGYWWCLSDKVLNKFEREFLKIGLNTSILIEELAVMDDGENKVFLLHLLGWASNKSKAGDTLMEYVESKNNKYANASLRALFPMVVSKMYKIDSFLVRRLLYSRSIMVRNKILGLLAFMSEVDILSELNSDDISYIKKLTKHKNKSLIATPAKMVIDKLKSNLIFLYK